MHLKGVHCGHAGAYQLGRRGCRLIGRCVGAWWVGRAGPNSHIRATFTAGGGCTPLPTMQIHTDQTASSAAALQMTDQKVRQVNSTAPCAMRLTPPPLTALITLPLNSLMTLPLNSLMTLPLNSLLWVQNVCHQPRVARVPHGVDVQLVHWISLGCSHLQADARPLPPLTVTMTSPAAPYAPPTRAE